MNRWVIGLFLLSFLTGCEVEQTSLLYVDPLIGTGGDGHTYPGPSMPFGMIQLGPDTRITGSDGASGYHYDDSTIYGFSHTHRSGTGTNNYGDILLMPTVGEINLNPMSPGTDGSGYSSRFSHRKEESSPGYYKVFLEDDRINAELTVSQRVGFHKYTYPKSEQSNLILDLSHRDEGLSSYVKVVNEYEIEGLRRSKTWANDQYVYFVIRFSKPFKDYGLYVQDVRQSGSEVTGKLVKAHFSFGTNRKEEILVKVSISAVNVDGARNNMEQEIPHWRFERTLRQAKNAWKNILSRYDLKSEDLSHLRTFYTAVYHQYLNPNLFMDVDSLYRGRDMLVHRSRNHDYHTFFSLWDTYRATYPLFTLMETEKTNAFIHSFLKQYEQVGMLPGWELSVDETRSMTGYHAVSIIADAYQKGIRNYSADLALEACIHSAEQEHLGLRQYKKFGYIPAKEESESVSKTLEYAYDDWCISRFAGAMGLEQDEKKYRNRSLNYKNLFDPETGFFRAKSDAVWIDPFDPKKVTYHYTDANAWQYLFAVQHDVYGLIELLGGNDHFNRKLDQLFNATSEMSGMPVAPNTGRIGQYAHGNEPCHHVAYLYNFSEQPWKSQLLVSDIYHQLYSDQPDGLPGNEDNGQLSAWYIFSSMGFYPVTPGSGQYVFGSPQVKDLTLHLENGNQFRVVTTHFAPKNVYVQQIILNGEVLTRNFIHHREILGGGTLEFVMGPDPQISRGIQEDDLPGSPLICEGFMPVPYIETGSQIFEKATEVALGCLDTTATIYYQVVSHSSPGTSYFREYQKALNITSSRQLRFYSQKDSLQSPVMEAFFYELNPSRKVIEIAPYSTNYSAGGDLALIDQVRGARNFRTGAWQGYQGIDLRVVVDLGFNQTVHRLGLNCLQNQSSSIFMPEEVIYEISLDGQDFEEVARVANDMDHQAQGTFLKEFTESVWRTARYVRVTAKNIRESPDWHADAGEKAWIFADELVIE